MTTGRCLLEFYLEEHEWSQRHLSRISNVPKSTISDYILGNSDMSLAHAKNIADALDLYIEDLYEWVPVSKGG